MIVVMVIVCSILLVISIGMVGYCLFTIRTMCDIFRSERVEIIKILEDKSEAKARELTEQVESLVTAIARQGGMQVIFPPRRGPLEPSRGFFDGKPEIKKVVVR